jgi:hypothetical protein
VRVSPSRAASHLAGALVAAGAFFVLLGGVFMALVGAFVFAATGFWGHGFFVEGLAIGVALVVVALLLFLFPPLRIAWGVLAIVLAILSLPYDALGGFVIGFLLTVAGGLVAIAARGGRPSPRIVLS